MSANAPDLTQAALLLPERERLALATRLLDSLHGPDDEDAEQAWLAESVRRIREAQEGKVETLTSDEVFGAARAALKRP